MWRENDVAIRTTLLPHMWIQNMGSSCDFMNIYLRIKCRWYTASSNKRKWILNNWSNRLLAWITFGKRSEQKFANRTIFTNALSQNFWVLFTITHDDVIKWKYFPCYRPFVPVNGEFPAQRPVPRNSYVFFDLRLNKRLSKQSWGWWFETLSRPLWRHCNDILSFQRIQLTIDRHWLREC